MQDKNNYRIWPARNCPYCGKKVAPPDVAVAGWALGFSPRSPYYEHSLYVAHECCERAFYTYPDAESYNDISSVTSTDGEQMIIQPPNNRAPDIENSLGSNVSPFTSIRMIFPNRAVAEHYLFVSGDLAAIDLDIEYLIYCGENIQDLLNKRFLNRMLLK